MVLISKILVPLGGIRQIFRYDVIKVKLGGQKVNIFYDMKEGQVTPHFKGLSEYNMFLKFSKP